MILLQIIAEVLTLISFIWLTVSVAGAEWVDVKFRYHEDDTWNWGIWRTCNTIDGDETVCMEAGAWYKMKKQKQNKEKKKKKKKQSQKTNKQTTTQNSKRYSKSRITLSTCV